MDAQKMRRSLIFLILKKWMLEMPTLMKIRIPMIVTADGKWAAHSSSDHEGPPDWGWIDEMCDHDKPTVNPRRYWVETAVEVPETGTVTGSAIPEESA